MSEPLVKVEGVSKKFCRDLKKSLWYGLQDIAGELIGSNKERLLRPEEFWAVEDVSFELEKGQCLGMIGPNGAGKSTLLKMLNGLINPDKGRIEMHGRIGALIELGSGFNPILTGRENIYNNAAVLGFTKNETDLLLDEIIAFSEIEEFIDTPVQYYSSGMKVRLGFSVAAHLKPDVLILDEVLAVGDAGFRIKSFNKISEIIKNAAVIFVSHSMPVVSRVCNRVMFMQHGREKYCGSNISKAIELYLDEFKGEESKIEYNGGAEIENLKVYGDGTQQDENGVPVIQYCSTLHIELDIRLKTPCDFYNISLQITDKDMKIVAQYFTNKVIKGISADKSKHIQFVFPNTLFTDGEYSLTIFVFTNDSDDSSKYNYLATYRHYAKFKMRGLEDVMYAPIHLHGQIIESTIER